MSTEPENLVLHLLREMRAEMATKSDLAEAKGALKSEIDALRSGFKAELHSLRADVASDIAMLQAEDQKTRRELGDQIAGLRRAVMEYHHSVIGHGVLISELEARIRRVEQHLDLPALDQH